MAKKKNHGKAWKKKRRRKEREAVLGVNADKATRRRRHERAKR